MKKLLILIVVFLAALGARADTQMMMFSFRVHLLTSGFSHANECMTTARPKLRGLRNLFRGLRYTNTPDAGEGSSRTGRLFYQRQYLAALQDGVALIVQEYELHILESNITERSQ